MQRLLCESGGIRTPDPYPVKGITSLALSVRVEGFEPPTYALSRHRSKPTELYSLTMVSEKVSEFHQSQYQCKENKKNPEFDLLHAGL